MVGVSTENEITIDSKAPELQTYQEPTTFKTRLLGVLAGLEKSRTFKL